MCHRVRFQEENINGEVSGGRYTLNCSNKRRRARAVSVGLGIIRSINQAGLFNFSAF